MEQGTQKQCMICASAAQEVIIMMVIWGIMEKKMEPTIMENQMETTIIGKKKP